MSLIVSVYVNEGIVMASDSRTTANVISSVNNKILNNNFPISDTAYKTFLCPNNCGISTCGNAGYNNAPIAGFIETFISEKISSYTKISNIPQMLIDFFNSINKTLITIFQVCGYEQVDGKFKQKIFRVRTGPKPTIDEISADNNNQGAIWDGETLYLSKLLKSEIMTPNGVYANNVEIYNAQGEKITIKNAYVLDRDSINAYPDLNIAWQYMTLQDAVDFAKFAIETTIKTMKFASVNKTVGGDIDILIIKPNQTKWLSHKKLKLSD